MTSPKQKFQLNLSGLLKVLADHLYSSKKVAIRELIQNAHDSTIRRQAEDILETYQPSIMVRSDVAAKTLTIEDNGAGLTEAEIINYLTTIGNSYTRELGEQLQYLSPEASAQLIGQFGLGFLSAFLIADKVDLVTRSYQSEQAYHWVSDGSELFSLEPTHRETVGTTITIDVKPEAQYVLRETMLSESIRTYADFLSVPIFLNGSSVPTNLMNPPWKASNPSAAIEDYIERTLRNQDVITIIPLQHEAINLGHDELVIPMDGFVYIPSSSVVSLREYGDLRVYIRGMFIKEDERYLLPQWARFMRGVIDCPTLQPTVSREDLRQEDNYFALQQALENQLLTALRQIATEKRDIWRKIVIGHTDLVLGWIVANDDFFEHVADSLLLRTTRGLIDVTSYLQQSNGVFYFTTREIGSLQEQLLGEGYEVPVIDASWFGVRGFLEKYASRQTNIRLVQMDGDARQLLQPVSENIYHRLLEHYRSKKILVKMASFKPESVPGVVLYPRNAEALRQAREALDSGDLSAPFAAMVADFLEQERNNPEMVEEAERGTLYLNSMSPLIQQLVNVSPNQMNLVLDLIYQVARLFAGRHLTPKDANIAFQELSTSIEGLLKDE